MVLSKIGKSNLFIPLSYMDMLNCISHDTKKNLFMDKYADAEEYINKFASASNFKDLSRRLHSDELKAVRKIIRNGGYLFEGDKKFPAQSTIERLERNGLAFKTVVDNKSAVVAPLEICLGLPFEKDETAHSLIVAMNRYSSDMIKLMASHIGISQYVKHHKIRLACIVYKEIIKGYPQKINSMNDRERFLLRTIFMRRGIIQHTELKAIARSNGFSVAQAKNWYGSDSILQYLTNPYYRRWPDNIDGDYERTIISLVLSGIIAISYRESYDSYWDYTIPTEVLPFIVEEFFKEMDEKRAAAEKSMYTQQPDIIVSYGGRVVEDIIKIQIACICGLIEEQKQKSEFKKRSIVNAAQMLNVSEEYVKNLLETFHLYRKALSGKVDYNGMEMLKAIALDNEYRKAVCRMLDSMNGWLNHDNLIQYIINHRDFYTFPEEHTKDAISSLIKKLVLLGLLDSSKNGMILRPSSLLLKVLDRESGMGLPVIKLDKKPIIVQPNLEIIVPFNVEAKALKKLSEFADLVVLDRMLHFSINKKSLIRAVGHDWDKRRILYFLSTYSSRAVPDIVRQFLEDTLSKTGEVEVIPVSMLIQCRGIGVKERLLSLKSIEAKPVEGTEDYLYIPSSIIDRNPKDVVKILKKNGIFAEIKEDKSGI
jgi:hypothetical protein